MSFDIQSRTTELDFHFRKTANLQHYFNPRVFSKILCDGHFSMAKVDNLALLQLANGLDIAEESGRSVHELPLTVQRIGQDSLDLQEWMVVLEFFQ